MRAIEDNAYDKSPEELRQYLSELFSHLIDHVDVQEATHRSVVLVVEEQEGVRMYTMNCALREAAMLLLTALEIMRPTATDRVLN